ncbi:MAG: arginine--tRNA ligase [Clostridiales bacterium]|nr:arginine--tRNA ligase [Clostridiales bacterium]
MDLRRIVANSIETELLSSEELYQALTLSVDEKNGDVCLPCFKLAKTLRKSPMMIAEQIKACVKESEYIEKTESVSGYLNFFLSKQKISEMILDEIAKKGEEYTPFEKNGKTVCIDYSSINIAKPFHIGHLLTTVIGGSLYRIYKYLGYETVGINHLGDWGTQFGKLIVAYKKWGSDEDIEKRTIKALLDLYVRFHKEAEVDESLNEEGRYWFKQIEEGNEEALAIFEKFKTITLKEVNKVYDKLGIKFDSYAGESFYNDKMQPVIDELYAKNLLVESEGAKVVNLDEYNMAPCLILKKDGATLYATRDLAAAFYRKQTYDFDKCLYVVAYQQNLHFKQVFKVVELMGYDWANKLVHVPFGMVSLEGATLSTREGNVVFLEDVLNTSVEKVKAVMKEKNADEEDGVAEKVGVGAVIFYALSSARIKDLVFSYDKALSFEGETGPYLQYTHARCRSVMRKAGNVDGKFDISALDSASAYEVIKLLNEYDATVLEAGEKYEPSIISHYLISLAKAYNKFYLENRIVVDDKDVTYTRVLFTKYVADALKNGLGLILIDAPNKM